MDGRLELGKGVVHPWHHDQFGHMNVRHYAPFFDDACFHIYQALGLSYPRMIAELGVHTVTASGKTTFIKELVAGDLIEIDGAVTRIGSKSVTFHLRMHHSDRKVLHATYDTTEVFFDPETRKSALIPETVRAVLAAHLVEQE
jgi:acyl-CoA thioester hydrolase